MLRGLKFLISHFVPAESGNIQTVREMAVPLPYSLLHYVCIPVHGMTLHDSATLCGSEHVTYLLSYLLTYVLTYLLTYSMEQSSS